MICPIWCFISSIWEAPAVGEIDQTIRLQTLSLVKVPLTLRTGRNRGPPLPQRSAKPYSDDPTQWLFHYPQPPPTATGRRRPLAGYRWPAETDTDMELADARTWIARCDKLAEHIDDDGIVCLPSVAWRGARA